MHQHASQSKDWVRVSVLPHMHVNFQMELSFMVSLLMIAGTQWIVFLMWRFQHKKVQNEEISQCCLFIRKTAQSCTVECVRDSCQSATETSGVCFSSFASQSQCTAYGVKYNTSVDWFANSLCVLSSVNSGSDCVKVRNIFEMILSFVFSLNSWRIGQQWHWNMAYLWFIFTLWVWESFCVLVKYSVISLLLYQSMGTMLDICLFLFQFFLIFLLLNLVLHRNFVCGILSFSFHL